MYRILSTNFKQLYKHMESKINSISLRYKNGQKYQTIKSNLLFGNNIKKLNITFSNTKCNKSWCTLDSAWIKRCVTPDHDEHTL